MSKNEFRAILIVTACNEWLRQTKPSGESKEIVIKLANMCQEYLDNSQAKMMRGGANYRYTIATKLQKKFMKIVRFMDKQISNGDKWIPALLANETLGLFFADKKWFSNFHNFEYYLIWDLVPKDLKETRGRMEDVANNLVRYVNGGIK